MKWIEFNPRLSESILEILNECGYANPTAVQVAAIPSFLTRKDVAVEAVTGSGKTLTFVVPIFQMLLQMEERLKPTQLGALIVEPTRELALQTFHTAKPFAKKLGFSINLLTGGHSTEEQEDSMICSNIIVGTPGRLASWVSQNSQELHSLIRYLEVLILDEADRLYSLGQAESVRAILSHIPKQRRTGLFSATLEESADVIAEAGMRNPVTIKLRETSVSSNLAKVPESLSIFYHKVQPADKFAFVVDFLKSRISQKHILFFSTCAAVEYFSEVLRQLIGDQLPILWIHGKIDKLARREKIFSRFKSSSNTGCVLVSTDLMSRGVDFPDVDWVIQFDAPSNPATFVHRCGRTARMNKTGSAVVLLLPNEIEYVRFIDRNQGIKMQAFKSSENMSIQPEKVLAEMRRLCLADRDLYEKSSRAFVSFIQFYRKHELSLIFQLKELAIGDLGYSYGLLQMPRMPEIRSFASAVKSFKPVEDVDFNSIPFKDSGREKQRQELLKKKERGEIPRKQIDAKEQRKKQRRDVIKKKLDEKKKKQEKAKRRAEDDSDWEELARDALLIKRLKAGKISEREYERAMGLSSDDD